MRTADPMPIRAGDVVEVRAGPGDAVVRTGVVVEVQVADDGSEPASYDVRWGDGNCTVVYASPKTIRVVGRRGIGRLGRRDKSADDRRADGT